MSDQGAGFTTGGDPGTWSNRAETEPLSLAVLQATYRRLTVCGLCGRKVELTELARFQGGWIVHARC